MHSKTNTFQAIDGYPERIPFNPLVMHLAASLMGVDYSGELCRKPELLAKAQVKCANFFGIDSILAGTDAYREASAWGIEVSYDAHTPVPKNHLDWREFDAIEDPDLNAAPRIQERMETIKHMKKMEQEKVIFGWIEAPFAELAYLFDLMEAVKIMREENWVQIYKKLLKRIVPVELEFAKMQIEAGVDIMGCGDAAISQIGPKRYKLASLDETRYLFDQIREDVPVLYHCCGDNSGVDREGNDMLELIASTGADIVDIDFQVDLAMAKEKIGKKICLRGNTNTSILGDPYERPERIVHEVTRNLNDGKPGELYMYGAGCEWPWEPLDMAIRNMSIAKALTEKLGWY
ncbi:MAG: uroporphyrinogen decarboxylase family protein [Candidatus Hodarchaeota archaeon]